MKNLITTIGSILVLMIFLMQFVANENTLIKLISVESAIKTFKINSLKDNAFNQDNTYVLKDKISKSVGCSLNQVIVDYDEEGNYHISAPIYGIIGPAKICGLSDKENMFIYENQGAMLFYEEPDNNAGAGNSDDNLESNADDSA